MKVTLPIKTESEANGRQHFRPKARRTAAQRKAAWAYLLAESAPRELPAVITLTRVAPRELDDDNLASSFKAIRDGIADYFKVDDRDKRYRWCYGQRRGDKGQYAVEIEISPALIGATA